MQHQILIPLDGSALAEAILPHAVAFARATGSTLTLLAVIPLTVVYDPTYGPLVMPEQGQKELVAVTRDYLATEVLRLETEGLLVHTEVLEGDVATSIVSYAEHDPSIQLIAMASRGRSGVGRLVFGSIAAQVLQATTTPLLLFCAHQHTIPVPGPVS